jgi:hypothetical protein
LKFFVELFEVGWHDDCFAERTLVLLLHPLLNAVVVKVVSNVTTEWRNVLVILKRT